MSYGRITKGKKEPTPEERVAESARNEAEAYISEIKEKSDADGVKFPPPEGISMEEIKANPERLLTEAQWIENFVKARVEMWKDSVEESKKRVSLPYLTWDRDSWSLREDWPSGGDWGSNGVATSRK